MGDGMDRPADSAGASGETGVTSARGADSRSRRFARTEGYRARFVQQNRSPNDEEIETHFDIRWKQAAIEDPLLDFLAVVNKYCPHEVFRAGLGARSLKG